MKDYVKGPSKFFKQKIKCVFKSLFILVPIIEPLGLSMLLSSSTTSPEQAMVEEVTSPSHLVQVGFSKGIESNHMISILIQLLIYF